MRGQTWEYFVPGWNSIRVLEDAYDAGKNLIGKATGTKSTSTNDRINAAQNTLNRVKAQHPGDYQSEYASQISGVQGQLNDLNKKGFQYDYTKDAAYQQYKNRYTNGARLASEDAAAQAAARSGGYSNSWGATSGQTAYQSTMAGLADAADSLYSQAYNEYAAKKNDLSSRLGALQQQEQLAQNAYNTRLSNYYNQLGLAQSDYSSAMSDKQQEQANRTNFWNDYLQLGAKVLPMLLSVL